MKTYSIARLVPVGFLLMTLTPQFAGAREGVVSDLEFLQFNLAHPEQDAANALAHGQPHCLSVNGYGKWFPGVDAADIKFCARIERNISGTSDDNRPGHEEVQRAAIAYATASNTLYRIFSMQIAIDRIRPGKIVCATALASRAAHCSKQGRGVYMPSDRAPNNPPTARQSSATGVRAIDNARYHRTLIIVMQAATAPKKRS
jgi:hypothetical protein